jgi:nicotinate-nucleotide adenylyltransferase
VARVMPSRRAALPAHAAGLRIGLFGGSFNPPHEAHRAVSLFALKRLQLDRVWWLVTPGNPLKDPSLLPPLQQRVAAAQAVAKHPRIDVTGLEAVIGTQFSYDTIAYLVKECPGVHFVWIMGADNLKDFHRWKNWRGIAALIPMAVIDRGGVGFAAMAGPAGQALARVRVPESHAASLAIRPAPAFVFLHGLKMPLSSTALREGTRNA